MNQRDDYVYMPLETIHEAKGFVNHIVNRWWCVDSERGLLFYPYNKHVREVRHSSPQCGTSEANTKRLCPVFAEVRFIESVLAPIGIEDYGR